nr:MAG TPA: hypothetical protein [Caudoviricetes sp.]
MTLMIMKNLSMVLNISQLLSRHKEILMNLLLEN